MKQKKVQPQQQKNQQVRGSDLRSQIMDSEEYGENYRSSHQGTDIRSPAVEKKSGR